MIEEGLYRFLTGNADVSALIGTRAYEDALPPSPKMPAVVYFGVTSTPIDSLDGENGLKTRRFQFDCYANKSRDAKGLKGTVRAAFEAIATGTTFPESSEVLSARIMLDMDKPFEPGPGGTIFCSVLDIELSFIPSN